MGWRMTQLDTTRGAMQISAGGLALIKSWEGLEDGDPTTSNLDPYLDASFFPTIGWGHLIKEGEDFSGGITIERAEELLAQDVHWAEGVVNRKVTVKLNQHQFDAIVSFVFNVGAGAFDQSTLLGWLNAARMHDIPQQLTRWNRSGGRSLLGLARRRVAEAALFLM